MLLRPPIAVSNTFKLARDTTPRWMYLFPAGCLWSICSSFSNEWPTSALLSNAWKYPSAKPIACIRLTSDITYEVHCQLVRRFSFRDYLRVRVFTEVCCFTIRYVAFACMFVIHSIVNWFTLHGLLTNPLHLDRFSFARIFPPPLFNQPHSPPSSRPLF